MTDVLIVGGGLAGLSTAKSILANSNYKVCLIEKKKNSDNNALRLTFTDVIKNYDLMDCIRAEYNSFGIMSCYGARSMHRFDDNRFVALDYKKSCDKFLNDLLSNSNFNCISDRATELDINEKYVRVSLKNNSPIDAKIFVDASGSGHFSLVQRDLGLPKLYSHSFGQSFEDCANGNVNEAWFFGASADYGSGGGWYYPLDEDKASVGFAVITQSSKFPSVRVREKYFKAIKEINPINQYLKSAKPVKLEAGTIPIDHISGFSGQRLLVTGDAAGQATPWMCMGIEPILYNSDMVADVAISALDANDFSASYLSKYDAEWNKKRLVQFNSVKNMNPQIWFAGDAVWDFIIEKDIALLTPQQFYERVRYNRHLMSGWTSFFRWSLFRLKHVRDWNKYKKIMP